MPSSKATTRRTTALPDKPTGPQSERTKTSAAQRAAALKKKHERQERRRRLMFGGGVGLLVAVVVVVLVIIGTSSGKGSGGFLAGKGPEGVPAESGTVLAKPASSVTGQTINSVQCGSSEQLAYHIHARLTIYVDGKLAPVPAGIGIIEPSNTSGSGDQTFVSGATKCFYWIHTHAQDGVIHVESPSQALYSLSDFFAIWGVPLSKDQVGPDKGTVTAYVDGKKYTGDPQQIQIAAHKDIQLDVGTPTPAPVKIDWTQTQGL